MEVKYIDAHCHLQFDDYDTDRDDVIATMREQKLSAVVIGCDLKSSQEAAALAETHDELFSTIGVHPNHTDEPYNDEAMRKLAAHPKVVGIGECGLDYFRPTVVDDAEKARQKALFQKQINLAIEFNKPLVIHARPSKGTQDAYHDVYAIVAAAKAAHPELRGDMHFFVGGVEEAKMFVDLGFTLSVTAVITFARDYDEMIRSVPLTSLLAETDAPYVAPISRRGKRNDPLAAIEVAEKMAEIRGENKEIVRQALLENTRQVFNLP